jgi:hypothetical protein
LLPFPDLSIEEFTATSLAQCRTLPDDEEVVMNPHIMALMQKIEQAVS